MANLTTVKNQFFDNSGNPLSGGKLWTYEVGTTTPKVSYTDATGTVTNTNPIILNSRGECAFWIKDQYKIRLEDSAGVEIYTVDYVGNLNNASDITYNPAGTGAVATTVQSKLRESVSVKDFGAVGDGVTDDTAAIQAAYASGAGSIYFPKGTYLLNAAISVPGGVLTHGDGYAQSFIKCRNDLSNIVFFTLTGETEIKDVAIYGAITAVGTGVLFSAGTYTFSGHGKLNKCRIYNFAKAVDVTSWFDLTINQTQIEYSTIGINATPLTNGGDNGYINCFYVTDCYFIGNANYDVYFSPAIRISEVKFTNIIFDPGATLAKVYIYSANPCVFDNCYFEGGPTVPAISSSLSVYTLKNCYLLNTKGISADSTAHNITVENCRIGSATDIINAGYALHTLHISGTSFPSTGNTIPVDNKYFFNCSINGITYSALLPSLTIGAGDTFSTVAAYQKAIGSVSVGANSTVALVSNQYIYGIMSGQVVGTATISDKYYPGLILTVTPATTSSTNYFSVLATNTTAASITVSTATLNVIIQRMSTYTVI